MHIHLSWFLVFFLVVLQLSDQVFPRQFPRWSNEKNLIVAAITATLFFASVLAHELAHSIVARAFRMAVSSITLFLLGGVANLTKEPPSARAEFLMAAAGPATSVVIGLGALLLAGLASSVEPVAAVAGWLGGVNLAVAVFNLIPGFPLDGGRVLRSVIWGISRDRVVATRIAARGGQIVAGLIVVAAAAFVVGPIAEGDWAQAFWLGLIAYFLYNAASATLQQERLSTVVGTVRVGQLMTTDFRSAPPGVMVGSLIRDIVLPMNLRAIPIVDGDRLVGLVTIGDLRKIEQDRWATTPVERVMTPAAELPTISPDDPLTTALARFGETELPLLPVVTGASLVGLLYRESVVGYVRMREMLGVEGRR